MDRMMGETFTVSLGGKDYTLSPLKVNHQSKAIARFKQARLKSFILLANEADLLPEIYSEQVSVILNENNSIEYDEFMDKYGGEPSFAQDLLFCGLLEFQPDLKMVDFERFSDGETASALEAFVGKNNLKQVKPRKGDKKKVVKEQEGTG